MSFNEVDGGLLIIRDYTSRTDMFGTEYSVPNEPPVKFSAVKKMLHENGLNGYRFGIDELEELNREGTVLLEKVA